MSADPHGCTFPGCTDVAVENHVCEYHRKVRVSSSWGPSEREEGDW